MSKEKSPDVPNKGRVKTIDMAYIRVNKELMNTLPYNDEKGRKEIWKGLEIFLRSQVDLIECNEELNPPELIDKNQARARIVHGDGWETILTFAHEQLKLDRIVHQNKELNQNEDDGN